MEHYLGAFFVIGTCSKRAAAFLSTIAEIMICKKFVQGKKIVPMTGFHSYTSKVLQSKIYLIEITELYDKTNYLSNNKLLCLLQQAYFKAVSNGFTPKGFIVTESSFENRSAIFDCLNKLFEICGNQCKKSIVVLEKRLFEPQRSQATNPKLISEGCKSLGVPCIMWRNSLQNLRKESVNTQVSTFIAALKNMEPYYATWMTELEHEIKKAPKIETTVESNVKEEIENDESDLDLDEMRNRLRSVSKIGSSMYVQYCRLTRRGVIKAARSAFGLETSTVSSSTINLPSKRKRNH